MVKYTSLREPGLIQTVFGKDATINELGDCREGEGAKQGLLTFAICKSLCFWKAKSPTSSFGSEVLEF